MKEGEGRDKEEAREKKRVKKRKRKEREKELVKFYPLLRRLPLIFIYTDRRHWWTCPCPTI
jgi:hypothetical protein